MTHLEFYVNDESCLSFSASLVAESIDSLQFSRCPSLFCEFILVKSTKSKGSNDDTRLQFPQRSVADLCDIAVKQQ